MEQGSIPSCDMGLTQNAPTWRALPNTTWTVGWWHGFLSRDQQTSSADLTSSPAKKKKKNSFSFTWRGVSWHHFHTMRPWHGLRELHALAGAGISFPPLKLCKGPAVTQGRSILGWSAWVPREWLEIILTGWTQFLPISAFQWRSYFWVMLYKAPGTAERNTTQLEETGEWHIWHRMRSCSQG